MTSPDRHASHDSPYRTGQHVPLNQSRHAPLTTVATAAESRNDLSSPYEDDRRAGSSSPNGWPASPGGDIRSPVRPYSPGMRSLSSHQLNPSADEVVSPGEIQMQSFHDGAPPPPPVSHSWKKLDRWAENHYEELFDQLCEGATQNDINELEHDLDCSLPQDVRDSLSIHDGQERGGRPTGILFGCMLLDCEEIVQEWRNWRTVNEEYLSGLQHVAPQYPSKALGGSSSQVSSSKNQASNPLWRQELLEKQDSQPPKAIQKAYAHPSWIPLARDWGGNNIAVDLAPGPMGKWGQVIIFGRDYDCKYVIARSWAAFLAVVADDMNTEKVFVDEDSGELKLREFKTQNIEPPYLEILRWRADQKYGRKVPIPKKRHPHPLNTNGVPKPNGIRSESPYNSPSDERGRSPNRFSRGGTSSPKIGGPSVKSPLSRVNEELPAPIAVRTGGDKIRDFAMSDGNATSSDTNTTSEPPPKLVEVATPVLESTQDEAEKSLEVDTKGEALGEVKETDDEKTPKPPVAGLGVEGIESEMKTVAI